MFSVYISTDKPKSYLLMIRPEVTKIDIVKKQEIVIKFKINLEEEGFYSK
jgi:hypothetical protein